MWLAERCHNATMIVTMTARLAEGLKVEAEAYAQSVGVSLNALLSVALRDYLDARQAMRPSGGLSPGVLKPPALPSKPVKPAAPLGAALAVESLKPPASRSDPCPCGAVDGKGYPVKWKHCHGRT